MGRGFLGSSRSGACPGVHRGPGWRDGGGIPARGVGGDRSARSDRRSVAAQGGAGLPSDPQKIALALNILPFAGVAFLWFIGVLRDRLGDLEDKFFASVFLGSGLLFLAMLFASAALAGGLLTTWGAMPGQVVESGVYRFARTTTLQLINGYGMRMAGVFVITTSTLAIRTGIFPRFTALLGYVVAALLLLGSGRRPRVAGVAGPGAGSSGAGEAVTASAGASAGVSGVLLSPMVSSSISPPGVKGMMASAGLGSVKRC